VEPTLAELRRRHPSGLDDEELLLRITMPQHQVDAMAQRRGSVVHVPSDSPARPILDLLEGLRHRDVRHVSITRDDFALTTTRRG
jgi:hypothetical protein